MYKNIRLSDKISQTVFIFKERKYDIIKPSKFQDMVSERYSVSEIAYMTCELMSADPRGEVRNFFRKRLLSETPCYSAFINTEVPPAMSKLMYLSKIPFHVMYGEDEKATTYEEYEEAKVRKEKIDNLILKGKSL